MILVILLAVFVYLVIGTIILKVLDEDSESIWFIFIWPLGLYFFAAIRAGALIYLHFKRD